ncbi:MAG: lipopolysaccharide transport periplasmic protein LptA [Desulfuromonas sp.]|nr:MAG: lipopolysaccharide transport periplasmic protein LptA [Desulfuromonas sp.]
MTRWCLMLSLICSFLVVVCTSDGWASSPTVESSRGPVKVTSDSMEADEVQGTLRFFGNAIAQQGDMTLTAERLTLFFSAQDREVERVLAEGAVRLVQPLREATGEVADYNQSEQRVTLSGQATVRQGGSLVQGEQIVLYLEDQRTLVTGGSNGRVNAQFQPQAKEGP